MKDKILEWFATGRVGASSKAMACAVAGMPNDKSHPHDPDDLNRCLLFLKAVPEARDHFDKVAAMNDYWKVLIENFAEIEACFIAEFKGERKGVEGSTYKLMRSFLDPVEKKDSSVVRFGNMSIRSI